MAYDVNGHWGPSTGPLAPISAKCSPPQTSQSIETGFNIFTTQGFKPSQLLLGIPTYGIGFGLANPTLEPKTVNGTQSLLYQKLSSTVPVSFFSPFMRYFLH